MKIKTTLAAACAACALTLGAGTYYVDYENGNDSTDGTAEGTGAWKTLAHAVGEAAADSEIVLATGTHLLSANITVNKALTIRGSGAKEETILSGDTNWRSITVAAAGCLFHSFTLPGATSVEAKEVCLWINDSKCASVVSNVVLRPIGTTTGCLPASPTIRVAAGTLTHLWATNCFANRSFVQLYGSAAVMENCYVADCASQGGQYEDAGLIMVWNCKPTSRNCTIVRNRIGNGYSAIGGDWSRNEFFLQNSIIYGNVGFDDATVMANVGQPVSQTKNFINNCTGSISGWTGSGNFTDDPMLQSDGRHFLSTSKCNHGADAATAPAYDIEGNLRTAQGANPSIGAFEYVAPPGLVCGIRADSQAVSLPATITLTCDVEGADGDVTYVWDKDGDGQPDGTDATLVISTPGIFRPTVTVSDGVSVATATYGAGLAVHAEGAARYFVDFEKGDNGNSGTEPDQAWATLSAALGKPLVYPGDVIELSRGVHHLTGNIIIDRSVTVCGAGTRDETILVSDNSVWTVSLVAKDAMLHTMTMEVTKSDLGYPVKVSLDAGSIASNFVMRAVGANPVANAGQVLVIKNSLVSELWATNGLYTKYFIYMNGGDATRIENSYFANNTTQNGGYTEAGLIMPINCSGYVRNCTIVDNQIGNGYAAYQGSWSSSAMHLENNIIWANTKVGDPETLANVSASSVSKFIYNCTKPIDGWTGAGNFTDDPALQPDRMHFAKASKCNHGADEQTATEYDIEGTLRRKDGAKPSIGAFEFVAPKGLFCSISPDKVLGSLPDGVVLTCEIDGEPTGEVSYEWDLFGDGSVISTDASPHLLEVGVYHPTVRIADEGGHTASSTYGGEIGVRPAGRATFFVDYANGSNGNDGLASDRAWKDLPVAMTKLLLAEDDEVVLMKGRHDVNGDVSLTRRLTIHGEGRPEETVLCGAGNSRTLSTPVAGSVLYNFTVAGSKGDSYYPLAMSFTGATASNLVIRSLGENPGPISFYEAQFSLSSDSVMSHCVVTNCYFGKTFIAFSSGLIEDSLIADNRVMSEDWLAWGLLYLKYGTPTVRNCTIANNRIFSKDYGGCVISRNGFKLINNIIWDNVDLETGEPANVKGTPNQFICNCTTTNGFDSAAFTGNIEADPLFKDASRGKYALTAGSPCRNAGDDSVVAPGETDLAGNPRIMSRHVDMGCYEKEGPGLMLLVK